MNQEWQIFIFGLVAAGLGSLIAAIGGFVFHLSNRITKLETRFDDWLDAAGQMAAKALHHTDDLLGIDKYLDNYIDHHHDMSLEDWIQFHDVLVPLLRPESKTTKLEKVQAEFLIKLCEHKISRSGVTHTKKLI